MTDLLPDPGDDWQVKLKRLLLDVDARIDSAVYQSGKWARELYERFTAFMDNCHVAGWRRWLFIEPLSEMATLGTGGIILMLALALPSFRETSDDDWLKKSELAVTFLDRYGNEVGSRGIKHNDSVPLEEMPDHLIKAVLATEDRRFYEHFGIDFYGTFRALMTNAKAGGVVQGGSTITQQLAKNLFLSNERTIERKINEAFLALWLETRLSKNEILKLYLDRAYLGGGAFGVNAAAEYYFGKSVRDVTLPEAAMLAGLFKAPTKFSPLANLPAARARANVVLDNLVDAGFMTEGQVYGARRNPATPVDRREEDAPNYYLDWAFDEMRKLVDTFPKSHDRALLRGAHRARHQSAALRRARRSKPSAAIRPRLWRQPVRAGDRRPRRRRARDGRRPRLWREPVQPRRRRDAPARLLVQALRLCHGAWQRLQADLDRGRFAGLHRQLVPAQLLRRLFRLDDADAGDHAFGQRHRGQAVDIDRQRQSEARPRQDRADREQLGIRTPLPDTPSLPIGADEVTVLDHAVAYATFPNLGKAVTPHARSKCAPATATDLAVRPRRQAPPGDAAAVAPDMVYMMNKVVEEGTGRAPLLGRAGRRQDRHHQWLPRRLVRWLHRQLRRRRLDRQRRLQPTNRMTGGSLPAMVWQAIMGYAHQGIEIKPLTGLPPRGRADAAERPGLRAAMRPPMLLTRGHQGADQDRAPDG